MHRTGHEEVHSGRPWLWTILAGAVVVGLATWWIRPQSLNCSTASPTTTVITLPAAPAPSSVTPQQIQTTESQPAPEQGEARFYAFSQGVACSLPDLPLDGYYVGVPTGQYDGSAPCGSYVDIDGPLGSVRAEVVDRCPACAPNQYDLSRSAFEAIANSADGVAKVRISRVRDPNPAPELVYRVEPSSSPSWISILFSGTGNPVAQVSLKPDSGRDYVPLRRGNDNYWSASGLGSGPFTAEVTDIYGHAAFVSGVTIDPGALRHTGVRLYEIPTEPPATPPPPTAPVVVTTVVSAPAGCKS
ncbi:expansin EXLX1 family cellulose-binding protein [Nocardia sp. CDC153]|uniref:expansin EXLX1 family cellulose-binding protein n=1 Tax=Nocardia sp. CDC153 TaxID=3112167 RepID=UPI002DB9C5B3|nr:expansin EXLX1 family cellulose-binding protein [Nocardia sp. CDC153]MEC3957876.1 expansin EXLX1 family cellulose-binding protein [Nocardia sp. CDC153]